MTDLPNIALLGGAGAGKDTAADWLVKDFGYRKIANADRLREVCQFIWPDEPLTRDYRAKLTTIGRAIEAVEGVEVPGEHTRALSAITQKNIDAAIGEGTPIVVSDVRFGSEYFDLLGRGFVSVRIQAPDELRENRLRANGKWTDGYFDKEIEHYLDGVTPGYTLVNDGDQEDFYEQLIRVLERERRRR